MNSELAQQIPVASSQLMIPGDFAEKAMASLMQLHSELMDEKERRVELYRKLMEREQTVAELRMYVRLLEEKLNPPKLEQPQPARPPEPAPQPVVMAAVPAVAAVPSIPSSHVRAPEVAPPLPPRVARPKVDHWKTW